MVLNGRYRSFLCLGTHLLARCYDRSQVWRVCQYRHPRNGFSVVDFADCNERRSQAAANAFASVYDRGGVLAAGIGEACAAAADLAAAALAAASAAAFF